MKWNRILAGVVALAAMRCAFASDPAYMSEMPTVEQVSKDMKTDDPQDTSARQAAAFDELQNIIKFMAGPRKLTGKWTADEGKMLGQYALAWENVQKLYPDPKQRAAVFRKTMALASADFHKDLMAKYFSAAFIAQYDKMQADLKGQQVARATADKAAMTQPKPAPSPMSKNQYDDTIAKLQDPKAGENMANSMLQMMKGAGFNVPDNLGDARAGYETKVPQGLRMNGAFMGDNGLEITFSSVESRISMGEVAAGRLYRVEQKGGKVVVTIGNQPKDIVLTLGADGMLTGSGSYEFSGLVPAGAGAGAPAGGTPVTHTKTVERTLSAQEAQQYPDAKKNGQEWTRTETVTVTDYQPAPASASWADKKITITLGVLKPVAAKTP